MRIAYAYHLDAASAGVQSGRPHSIFSHLRQLGTAVDEIFPLSETAASERWLRKAVNLLAGRAYLRDRHRGLLQSFARQIERALATSVAPADLVFSPSTLPLSYLETSLPMVFCADAPFGAMRNYYDSFTRLSPAQVALSEQLEQRVLDRCALAIYPSEWAARAAVAHHGIAPEKVAVIPFGANLGQENTRTEVARWIEERSDDTLRLLFVGKDWRRKGGDLVVETARWLVGKGVPLRLDVVGCEPPSAHRHLDYVHCHGELSPDDVTVSQPLRHLFQQAHFLFVPSRAEAYGMVFCEANAFGLPVLSTDTGGIRSIVREGVNGFLLPSEAGPADFGEVLLREFSSTETYRGLARSSFDEFETRLNWKTFCQTFLARTAEACHPPAAIQVDGDLRAPLVAAKPPLDSVATRSNVARRSPSTWIAAGKRPDVAVTGPRPPRIGFLSDSYIDPDRVGSWSGLPYYFARNLRAAGCEVVPIRGRDTMTAFPEKVRQAAWRFGRRRRYLRGLNPGLLRAYADSVRGPLRASGVDVVFSASSWLVSRLETDLPIVFWTDATFASMLGFYDSFSRLAPPSLAAGHATERAALERCALAVYSSDWAARSAVADYGANPDKVRTLTFGANVENAPGPDEAAGMIAQRAGAETCELLLIGVDWVRKGAAVAVETLAELGRLGVRARLRIAGCRMPAGFPLPPNVEVIGFLDKSTPEGRARMEELYRSSHFFILPSRAEAYGVVLSEANAYGLPCLATDVGGLPNVVTDEKNGRLFPLEAGGTEYARWLAAVWREPGRYRALSLNSFEEYRTRLDGVRSGERLAGWMRELVPARRELPVAA